MRNRIIGILAFLSLFVGMTAPSWGSTVRPKVTLLTSIDEATFKGPFYLHWGYFEHYLAGLEAQFQDHFKDSGYEMNVIHEATREQLYSALHDPANVGVFWLSHSTAVSSNPVQGVEFDPRIIDDVGSDVKELFQNIDPNIKWLSIVACNSATILQNEIKDAQASQHIQGLGNEQDARIGLQQALQQSDNILLSPNVKNGFKGACPTSQGRPVLITRTISSPGIYFAKITYPAVTIDFHGRSIGAFPEYDVTDQLMAQTFKQSQLVFLDMPPQGIAESSDLNLTVNTGLDAIEVTPDLDFGSFEITGFWTGAEWKALSSPVTGKPFGVTQNLFVYSGPLKPDSSLKTYPPFDCEDVDAVAATK